MIEYFGSVNGTSLVNVRIERTNLSPSFAALCQIDIYYNKYGFLKATPHETTAVWPLTSYLENHPSKTNKTCRTLLEKQGCTHK